MSGTPWSWMTAILPSLAWDDGSLEVVERPAGASVARRGDEQRVVAPRLIGEAPALVVGILGRSASPGELDPQFVKDRQDILIQDVAGIGEADGPRDAVSQALGVDGFELLDRPLRVLGARGLVVAGVVADLEAVTVKLGDLVPGHVVAFVRREVEAFGDEEGRAEAVFLEQRGRDRHVRLAGVVERQDDELVRYRLEGEILRGGKDEQQQYRQHGSNPIGRAQTV